MYLVTPVSLSALDNKLDLTVFFCTLYVCTMRSMVYSEGFDVCFFFFCDKWNWKPFFNQSCFKASYEAKSNSLNLRFLWQPKHRQLPWCELILVMTTISIFNSEDNLTICVKDLITLSIKDQRHWTNSWGEMFHLQYSCTTIKVSFYHLLAVHFIHRPSQSQLWSSCVEKDSLP